MTDGPILRTVNLPRSEPTLTLERSAMYPRTPYLKTGTWHRRRYSRQCCASAQEAEDTLDCVASAFREVHA